MPDARAPRIARALPVAGGDGDDAAGPAKVIHADRDRPCGQLRRHERAIRIERVDDEVADGAARGQPADLVRRPGRRIEAREDAGITGLGGHRADPDDRRGPASRTGRRSRPVRVPGAGPPGAPRSRRTSGAKMGCAVPPSRSARTRASSPASPSRSIRDELPASWTTDRRVVAPRARSLARRGQGRAPGDPDRVAVADQAVEDGAGEAGDVRRSRRRAGVVRPRPRTGPARTAPPSRPRARGPRPARRGTRCGRGRRRGRPRSGARRGTARSRAGTRSRPCSAGDRRRASRPGSRDPAPGRRWAAWPDGRPCTSEMQPLICARIKPHAP